MTRMDRRPVFALLEEAAASHADRPALHQPAGSGKYKTWTFAEYKQQVSEVAAGLRHLGYQHGDVIAIHSETRAEFYIADIGIMTAGCQAAALYISYAAAELVQTLRACDAKAIFVETPKALQTLIAGGGGELGARWILLTGESDGILTLDGLRELGRKAMWEDSGLFDRIKASVSPDDTAVLYLTSGATGEPKMVQTSHWAIVFDVDTGSGVFTVRDDDCAFAFLPSAHIAQRLGLEMLPLRVKMPVYFSESLLRMPHELRSVKPTLFMAPPRVWERIYSSVCTEIKKRGALTRQIFYASLGLGAKAVAYKQEGKPVPAWLQQAVKVADKAVYSKIRDRFGGRMRTAISGAAPLSRDLAEFYYAIGMPITEGYGLTESGVVTLNPESGPRLGSVGKPFPGIELKLAEDGELLIKSPTNLTCYYKDPAATAAVLEDGWLHTGDIASIADDGYVSITGRKKEMIVASNGKKIYPSRLEALFKTEPLISQMVVAGDRQSYVSALFTINPATAETLPGMDGMAGRSIAEVASAKPVFDEVKKAVRKANKQLAPFEQVKKFKVLDREFSIELGELTPTMKVRRAKVLENFKAQIAEMYAGKEDNL